MSLLKRDEKVIKSIKLHGKLGRAEMGKDIEVERVGEKRRKRK